LVSASGEHSPERRLPRSVRSGRPPVIGTGRTSARMPGAAVTIRATLWLASSPKSIAIGEPL